MIFTICVQGVMAATVIDDCVELQKICHGYSCSGSYELNDDIDCYADTRSGGALWNGGKGFDPITTFTGTFDGKGHTISGVYINRPRLSGLDPIDIGLFGRIQGATIKNLGVIGPDVTGGAPGGLVAGNYLGSLIDNCYVLGGSLNGDGSGYATGGLVGTNYKSNIKNSYSTATVNGEPAGGLVGFFNGQGGYFIENSYAAGNINGVGGYGMNGCGGLVGKMDYGGTIRNCYAIGTVSTPGWSGGGLVGAVGGSCVIQKSYALGAVSANNQVGGLVGGNGGTISDSYAAGKVNGGVNNGGLVGGNSGTVTGSYWDKCRSGQTTSASGTGINSDGSQNTYFHSKTNAPMSSWSFPNPWSNVCNGNGNQRLAFEGASSGDCIASMTRCCGAGTHNCGPDKWLDNYRCSGSQPQRKFKTYSCSGTGCSNSDSWKNYGAACGTGYDCETDGSTYAVCAVAGKSNGESCASDSECLSTHCVDGVCCDNTCTGICKACDLSGHVGTCTNVPNNQDPDGECSTSWNSCDSKCVRRGADGYCDGSGACDTNDRTQNIASGYVCTGSGSKTAVSSSNYCNYDENCDNGDCSATEWFTSCNGAGSCRGAGDHTNSYSRTVYANTGKTLTNSCGKSGTTLCGYSGWNQCDGKCQKRRDKLRCDASHNCAYDVGDDDTNCPANTACSGGTCSSSYYCDSTRRCSSGSGNNKYNAGGAYYCKGRCDGSNNCDYAVNCEYGDDSSGACETCGGWTWTADGGSKNCCGDDGSSDDYCSGGYTACLNGNYYTNGDSNSYTCECGKSGTQGTCGNGESGCWDSSESKCCGDDGSSDDWCAGGYTRCNDGTFRTDGDYNSNVCGCGGGSWLSAGTGSNSKCCGDDGGSDDWEAPGGGNSACYNAAVKSEGSVFGSGNALTVDDGKFFDCNNHDGLSLADDISWTSCTKKANKYCTDDHDWSASPTVSQETIANGRCNNNVDDDCDGSPAGSTGYDYFDSSCCASPSGKTFTVKTDVSNCFIVDQSGDVALKGTFSTGSITSAPANSFVIKTNGGDTVGYVDSSCNMKIEGSLNDNQGSISAGSNNFLVKLDGGSYVFKVDSSGNFYSLGQFAMGCSI